MQRIFFILLWLGCLGLGNWLVARQARRGTPTDLVDLLFGESRVALGERLFENADRYFHRGIYVEDCDDFAHPKPGTATIGAADGHRHGHHHAHGDGHVSCCPGCGAGERGEGEDADGDNHQVETIAGDPGDADLELAGNLYLGPRWWRFLYRQVRPSLHMHASGERQVKELLPWFKLATKVDPRNVQAYEVGAYWLAGEIGQPAAARQFLAEGIAANPEAFELELMLGEILRKSEPEGALAALRAAAAKWRAGRAAYLRDGSYPRHLQVPDPVLYANILVMMADCHLRLGQTDEARRCFEEALPHSGAPATLRRRLAELTDAAHPLPASSP